MIGAVIKDQYEILELIGEGGMGSVYMALDTELGRRVALKFLKAEIGDEGMLVARFRDELRTLAGFNHPNITTLYTSVTHHGQPVMVMELVEGETLLKMVNRRGPIPADVCVPLISQALLALNYAHRKKIIHRDLKPANLMCNLDGVVKVMDFGIAKMQDAPGLTRTNTIVGTSLYMAPEQILGAQADARSDVYAMGITLYQLLAGRVPFWGDSQYQIEHAHIQQIPDPPTIYYPHIPEHVVQAVMRSLAKDPAVRFQTAAEFEAALNRQASVPTAPEVAAPPPPISTVVHPSSPSHLSETAGDLGPPRPMASLKPVVRDGVKLALVAAAGIAAILAAAGGYFWLGQGRTSPAVHNGSKPTKSAYSASVQPQPNQDREVTPTPRSADPPGDTRTPPGAFAVPRSVAPTKAPKVVVQQSSASGLAGQWSGSYERCEDNRSTRVLMNLMEPSPGQLSGSMAFATPDGVKGRCSVNGVVVGGSRVTMKAANCSGSAPAYFQADHSTLLSLSGSHLSGNVEPQEPCMTVSLRK